MSVDPRSYEIALHEIRTPGTYFYFQNTVDSIETIEQCRAYLDILEHDCRIVAHHNVSSYIKCIYQAKVDLMYQKYFQLRTELLLKDLN